MKKMLPAILAIVLAAGAAAFTAPEKQVTRSQAFEDFYYRFDGAVGEESDMSQWTQISQSTYNSLSCTGSAKACKITNTTNSGGHPTSVPLSGGLPQQTGANVEVRNKP